MKEIGGTTRYLILGMLAYTPLTGYGIRKWIEHEYSHFWQASYGQIYPILKSLTLQGLAEKATEAADADGRGQIAYRITDAGRDALRQWLEKEPEVEKLRYEILLKFSFGKHTAPDVMLAHLDAFIRRNEATLQTLRDDVERLGSLDLPKEDLLYSKLTARCGLYHYTAMRDWAIEARNALQKKEEDVV